MAIVTIVDSSLLIEAYHRKVLDRLEVYLHSKSATIAPPRVYQETVTEPKSLGYFATSVARIEKLFTHEAVKIEEPDYTDHQVSDVVDRVRECIAKKSKKPVHMIERADLQIVALAVSHAKKGEDVNIVFRDNALKNCLELVLRGQRISGVSIINSSQLVQQLS